MLVMVMGDGRGCTIMSLVDRRDGAADTVLTYGVVSVETAKYVASEFKRVGLAVESPYQVEHDCKEDMDRKCTVCGLPVKECRAGDFFKTEH